MSDKDIGRRFASEFLADIATFISEHYDISDLGMEQQAVEYVKQNCEVTAVFDSGTLGDWAEANGYEKVTP